MLAIRVAAVQPATHTCCTATDDMSHHMSIVRMSYLISIVHTSMWICVQGVQVRRGSRADDHNVVQNFYVSYQF